MNGFTRQSLSSIGQYGKRIYKNRCQYICYYIIDAIREEMTEIVEFYERHPEMLYSEVAYIH
jgi:hypothetical protein